MNSKLNDQDLKNSDDKDLKNSDDQDLSELRNFLISRKLTNTTKGACSIAPLLKKITNIICKITIKALTCKDVEINVSGLENIPDDSNVIFAQSHQGILDNFIWIPQVKKHSIILHHEDVNKWLLRCQLNTGLILISKKDDDSRKNAKLDAMSLLMRGYSVTWFPEGTYNLSPNKFHLPMSYGFIDAARVTGVPIIPVVHDYVYEKVNGKNVIKKVFSSYGKPIYVTEKDDLSEKLAEYSESISTLKWEISEKKGVYSRDSISTKEYADYVGEVKKSMALAHVDPSYEAKYIFRPKDRDDFYYENYPINDVPVSEKGDILNGQSGLKIKKISKVMRHFR